jgi:hypothetical protein
MNPNAVERLFGTPIPTEVWHYTTLTGFEGIVTSGKLWATDARFTNDRTEFIHAREIAREYIASLKPRDRRTSLPLEAISSMLERAFDAGALSPSENQVYLASFTEASDSLSQWGLYADACEGLCIAFDLRRVRPPKEANIAVTFAPCLYKTAEKEELIETALSHFVRAVERLDARVDNPRWMERKVKDWKLIQGIYGLPFDQAGLEEQLNQEFTTELLGALRLTLFDLLRAASHCKSEAFAAEQEWRLAMARPTYRPSAQNPVKFRGANQNIPYLESDLFAGIRLPITKVRLGPLCPDSDRVRDILTKNGYSVPVEKSAVPFRDTKTL